MTTPNVITPRDNPTWLHRLTAMTVTSSLRWMPLPSLRDFRHSGDKRPWSEPRVWGGLFSRICRYRVTWDSWFPCGLLTRDLCGLLTRYFRVDCSRVIRICDTWFVWINSSRTFDYHFFSGSVIWFRFSTDYFKNFKINYNSQTNDFYFLSGVINYSFLFGLL